MSFWKNIFSKQKVLFFPSSYMMRYQVEEIANDNIVLRTEVINKLLHSENSYIIVTYAQALTEKIITQKNFKEQTFILKKGEKISIDFLNEILFNFQFKRVDYITEPGEFAVRGGIIDVFSYADENPIRINFFGDEIDALKKFDIETQLSFENINLFELIPNIQQIKTNEERESIFNQIPKDSIICLKDEDLILKSLEINFKKFKKKIKKNLQTTLILMYICTTVMRK